MNTEQKLKYIATRLIDDVHLSMTTYPVDAVDTFRALERLKLGADGLESIAVWMEGEE